MKIYTKTGDTGETSLASGARCRKDDARIMAVGALDECNAALGVALAQAVTLDADDAALLEAAQGQLFFIGAVVAQAPNTVLAKSRGCQMGDVEVLEKRIDTLESALPPLTAFILPGGAPQAAALHFARTVCRRAERALVAVDHTNDTYWESVQPYMNRLSDYLFVLARWCNYAAGTEESVWKSE